MKRYNIRDVKRIMDSKCSYIKDYQDIRFDRFTLLYAEAYDKKIIFPECQEQVKKLCAMSCEGYDNYSEEDMYQDIFSLMFNQDMVKLDAYLHIYYTLLYEKNKDSYIPLTPDGCAKEVKDEIKKGRKECRRYVGKRVVPFEIIEGDNVRNLGNGKKVYEKIKIPDFAPNMVRLYYSSKEFRNIFKVVNESDVEKYKYSEIRKIFGNKIIEMPRKEEIWLSERLFGINLAWSLYSFFSVVLKDMTFQEIVNCKEDIEEIIHGVMCWEGIYSRNLIVSNLKIIYEIRVKADKKNGLADPKEMLQYLAKNVIRENMEKHTYDYTNMENYFYNVLKGKEDEDTLLLKVGKECNELMEKLFCNGEGYCLLNGTNEFIQRELSENENKILGDKLYALIQKIVISELIK